MRSEISSVIMTFSYVSFLLTYPNFGPVALKLIELKKLDPYDFFLHFYIFHIAGIIFSALILDSVVERIKLLKVATALTIVFSVLTIRFYQAIAPVGFFMGILVVIMGSFFARFVKPWNRGKLLALGASIANVYLFYFYMYKPFKEFAYSLTVSVVPLFLMYLLPNFRFERTYGKLKKSFVYFSFPVLIFYLVGGIMYGSMEPKFREAGIEVHVLFYALLILIAGYIYDKADRKNVAIIGLLTLSASILLFPTALEASAYLIQSAYAFIDVFAMMIWADISVIGSEARQYGIGMLFITTPILAGFVLTKYFTFQLSTILAISLLVFSAFLIGSFREPVLSPNEYMRWLSRR